MSKVEHSKVPSDIELIELLEKSFYVHKAILWARCSYFVALFDWPSSSTSNSHLPNSLGEGKKEVTLGAISSTVFEEIILFIYTSNIKLTTNNAVEMLIAANQYDLGTL